MLNVHNTEARPSVTRGPPIAPQHPRHSHQAVDGSHPRSHTVIELTITATLCTADLTEDVSRLAERVEADATLQGAGEHAGMFRSEALSTHGIGSKWPGHIEAGTHKVRSRATEVVSRISLFDVAASTGPAAVPAKWSHAAGSWRAQHQQQLSVGSPGHKRSGLVECRPIVPSVASLGRLIEQLSHARLGASTRGRPGYHQVEAANSISPDIVLAFQCIVITLRL